MSSRRVIVDCGQLLDASASNVDEETPWVIAQLISSGLDIPLGNGCFSLPGSCDDSGFDRWIEHFDFDACDQWLNKMLQPILRIALYGFEQGFSGVYLNYVELYADDLILTFSLG